MARQSIAALSIVRPPGGFGFGTAPKDLSGAERQLWDEIVESKPADWFGPDNAPLLKEYVRAAVACDQFAARVANAMAGDDDGLVKTTLDLRDRESRRAASLATKMRLTQQSRYGARDAARADSRAQGKRPWQT